VTAVLSPGLRGLVAPLSAEVFLDTVQGREARYFPGHASRFEHLFSFQEMNRVLGMWRLWTDRTFKVVLDGRDLPAEEYCNAGQGRDGHAAMLVDARRVEPLLASGATVVLDLMESLAPGVRALGQDLQSALGGATVCNAYCSFEAHAGFPSHYDTTDVFALHIAGVKRWRVYRGRAENPTERPGHRYPDQPREHHERAKGAMLMEVEMTPGDVLYLPRGQYHDALAASGASLHLSFGITRATGLDFMSVLSNSLPDDALFRRELPHFDDSPALAAYLRELATRLGELVTDPALAMQVAAWQRARMFRDLPPTMTLPARAPETRVRVRRGAHLDFDGARLSAAGQPVTLNAGDVPAVQWMLVREMFLVSELVSECALDEARAASLLDRLVEVGVIEPV